MEFYRFTECTKKGRGDWVFTYETSSCRTVASWNEALYISRGLNFSNAADRSKKRCELYVMSELTILLIRHDHSLHLESRSVCARIFLSRLAAILRLELLSCLRYTMRCSELTMATCRMTMGFRKAARQNG